MRRTLALLLTLSLTAAACGDDGEATGDDTTTTTVESTSTTTAAPTTTPTTTTTTMAEPAVDAADLTEVGPFPVGVTTRTLPTGNLVEVWYPAGPDAEGQSDTYAVRDFTPQLMQDLIPAETNDEVTVAAGRDATVAEGDPFPLVLFSHGSTSFRFQSTTLTHHLASWGMVVASPDHPSRGLAYLLEPAEDPSGSVDDMFATLELVLADNELGSAIDPDQLGVAGHSAGGRTTIEVARSGDFSGYVSYASGAFDEEPLPETPSLFMAGANDTIIEPGRTRDAFERSASPSWYLEFADSGHLVFSDLCAVGDGDATLIGLAEAAGLGDFLDDDLRRLGTDGCDDPNRAVTDVWPGIHQATTGFFRYAFGIDAEPIGLDAPAVVGVVASNK